MTSRLTRIRLEERPRRQRIIRRGLIASGIVLAVSVALVPVVALAQSQSALYSRDSDNDISVAEVSRPKGLWGDGTTVWAASWYTETIRAYTLADGTRNSSKDLAVNSGESIEGLWSDDTTMWVLRTGRDAAGGPLDGGATMEGYTLSDGARNTDKDITLDTANLDPAGLWSDGTTVWISDRDDRKLYAYTLSDGARDADNDITLDAANRDPAGLWSDDTTVWVADRHGAKLYGYTLSDGSRDANKDFSVAISGVNQRGAGPRGIWSNDTTMWIAESTTNKLYAFHMTGTTQGGI